ncbi:myosuppressin isoform X2 [Anabrus simplex]|uniref:myosuppressin isoform X2 n=1 Tax=Anabrus simplex TaxID=316456 RepID=UPI0034DDB9F5
MKCVCLALFAALSLLLACSPRGSLALPPCSPANLEDAPLRLREMCAALYKLSNAMQVYMDDNKDDADQPCSAENLENASPRQRQICADLIALAFSERVNGVKRQDIDHVFLRFGRR